MPLPTLNNAMPTIRSLHQAAMLFGPVHAALLDHRKNYLNLPMFIKSYGLVSHKLPKGGEICLNFRDGAIVYYRGNGENVLLPINGKTQADLTEALLEALKADELAEFLAGVDEPTLAEGLIKAINDDEAKTVFLKAEEITSKELLVFEPQYGNDYADVLNAVYTGVARARAQLEGHMTPIVVWPEHFDLSTLWFVDPEMDDHKQHINIGFAPYSGTLDQPYLYAYAYPYPENLTPPALPSPARWESEDYTGPFVAFSDIASHDDPVELIEDLSLSIFHALHSLLA